MTATKAAAEVASNPGLRAKLETFLRHLVNDYKTVALETVQDCKDRPFKAAFYASSILGLCGLLKTNPDWKDYEASLVAASGEISLVPEYKRNPESEHYVKHISYWLRTGRLTRRNLFLFSVIERNSYGENVDLFAANCSHLTPWYEWPKRVVDVGVWGRWMILEKEIEDFDVHPENWRL